MGQGQMACGDTDPNPMTIAELLAQHPWPREHADERRLEWLWQFDLPVGR